MTKAELIDRVVKALKEAKASKKACEEIIDTTFGAIAKAIKQDGRFAYPDFGTFNIRKRAARKGRNPQTGEEIKIKASKTVGFKPAPSLKKGL